jgi:hypothetical protein
MGVSIWDVSLDTANLVYVVSWIGLIIGAILTAVATLAAFWSSAVRDKHSDTQIQTARTEAAKANERAATLENEAAQARLEQEKLKAQLAWRVLPPAAVTAIEQRLSQAPSAINVEHVANDPEALYLAIQIANIFERAKWQIAMNAVTMAGTVVFGIWIPNSQSPTTAVIQGAFTAAGVGFSTGNLPPAGMGFGGNIPGAPKLFIGSKRPPT